jgi:hypothetical protein
MNKTQLSDSEIRASIARFFELRMEDFMSTPNQLFQRAMDQVLPLEKRRTNVNYAVISKSFKMAFESALVTAQAKATEMWRAGVVPTGPKPEPEKVYIVNEVEVEKPLPPLEKILAGVTTGQLMGHAIDRFLGEMNKPSASVIKLNGNGTNGHVPSGPTGQVFDIRGNPVVETKEEDKRKRVLVCGIIPEVRRIVEEKTSGFSRLNIAYVENDDNKVPTIRADQILMMRKFIGHHMSNMAAERYGAGRIRYIEGGQSELLRTLADLNSQ